MGGGEPARGRGLQWDRFILAALRWAYSLVLKLKTWSQRSRRLTTEAAWVFLLCDFQCPIFENYCDDFVRESRIHAFALNFSSAGVTKKPPFWGALRQRGLGYTPQKTTPLDPVE